MSEYILAFLGGFLGGLCGTGAVAYIAYRKVMDKLEDGLLGGMM